MARVMFRFLACTRRLLRIVLPHNVLIRSHFAAGLRGQKQKMVFLLPADRREQQVCIPKTPKPEF